jgi:serine protease Do
MLCSKLGRNTYRSGFLTLGALLALSVCGAVAGEREQKDSREQAETTLVRLNITTENRGSSESVEINGKRIADYHPTIIQVFPSTGVVMDEQGHVLTFLGYRWVDIRSPSPRIDIFTSEGQKYKGKLIGIDQSMGVAVVLALEGKLKKTPICVRCEMHDGTTVVTPIVEGSVFQQFKTAQILSVGPLANAAEQGSLLVTINQPLPGVGEPILNTEHHVLGFVASQKPSSDDPMGVRSAVYLMSQLLNSAERIIQAGGDIRTGWLGVYLADNRLPSGKGVMIKQIEEDSPAQRAGLIPQDTLVKWNGKEILDARQFIQLVQNTSIGSRISLEVLRQGKPLALSALIEARKPNEAPEKFVFNFPGTISIPGQEGVPDKGAEVPLPRIGIETTPLTPELADALHMPGQTGLLVLKVSERMAAGQAGVLDGDVIVSADGERISDPQSFASHIRRHGWGGRLVLKLLRKGVERTAIIRLPKSSSRKP